MSIEHRLPRKDILHRNPTPLQKARLQLLPAILGHCWIPKQQHLMEVQSKNLFKLTPTCLLKFFLIPMQFLSWTLYKWALQRRFNVHLTTGRKWSTPASFYWVHSHAVGHHEWNYEQCKHSSAFKCIFLNKTFIFLSSAQRRIHQSTTLKGFVASIFIYHKTWAVLHYLYTWPNGPYPEKPKALDEHSVSEHTMHRAP